MKNEYITLSPEGEKIKKENIIGIFDLDDSKTTEIQKAFLKKAEKEKRLVSECFDIPKAFLLCDDNTIFLSDLSAKTICGRAKETALDKLN